MIDIQNCSLIVVDVQGKLAQLMCRRELLFKNIRALIKAAKILGLPIIWTQQVPKALGETIPQIVELLTEKEPINKASFSCCREEKFMTALNSLNRPRVLLCGIETHICIYQTALDLLEKNYSVQIIADAVSSRALQNNKIALDKMQTKGIEITSTEMVLFELLKTTEHPQFKKIAELIK
ncbi:hydrolase [Planctomycetota bacterium]